MLAMRRESDNNITSSNNPSHNYTASSLSGESNLTHLNYPHPIHGYSPSNYSGYQSSMFKFNLLNLQHYKKNCLHPSKVTDQIQH